MKDFQINSTLNGEPVLLTIIPVIEKGAKQTFAVKKGDIWLADIQIDGECIVTFKGKNLFNDTDRQRLCRQVYRHKDV